MLSFKGVNYLIYYKAMTCNLCKNSTAYCNNCMPKNNNVMKKEEIKKDSLLSDVDKFASRLSEMDKRLARLERVGEKPFEQSKEDWEEKFDKMWHNKFAELVDKDNTAANSISYWTSPNDVKDFIRQVIRKRDEEIIKWADATGSQAKEIEAIDIEKTIQKERDDIIKWAEKQRNIIFESVNYQKEPHLSAKYLLNDLINFIKGK